MHEAKGKTLNYRLLWRNVSTYIVDKNLWNLQCKDNDPDSKKKSNFLPVNIIKNVDLGEVYTS